MSQRVALYEELNGRMIVHREGSPHAFAVIDFVPGGFTTDAAQLAAVEARVPHQATQFALEAGNPEAYGFALAVELRRCLQGQLEGTLIVADVVPAEHLLLFGVEVGDG